MSKKSKMKEREEASYIAPCENVVVELPFMVNVIRSIQYSVLPQRLRTGSKSATAASHWGK